MKIRNVFGMWLFATSITLTSISLGQGPKSRAGEDFTTPNYKTSKLKSSPPLVFDRHERKEFVRELIHVTWRPLDEVTLYVIRPKESRRVPVILYLYSYPQDASRFLKDDYCRRLVDGGYAAVGFESALTGDRYKMRPMREWFVSELAESLTSTCHDISMILDYLQSRPEFDLNRVGIFGQGSGGSIGILSASVDSRIKAVDILDPWCNWPIWLKHTNVVPENERAKLSSPSFAARLTALEPAKAIASLGTRPVRCSMIYSDESAPSETYFAFKKSLKPSIEYRSYPDMASFEKSGHSQIWKWLKSKLK